MPSDGSAVSFPDMVGSLELEFYLVDLALRVGVSYNSSPLQLLSRSAREREGHYCCSAGLCFPLAPTGTCQ